MYILLAVVQPSDESQMLGGQSGSTLGCEDSTGGDREPQELDVRLKRILLQAADTYCTT